MRQESGTLPRGGMRVASTVALAASATLAGTVLLSPTAAFGTPATACPSGTPVGSGVCEVDFDASTSWSVPTGVTSIDVLAVGGGGGGGSASGYGGAGGGGGGGQVAVCAAKAVGSGDSLTVSVGSGGDGGDTSDNDGAGAAGSPGTGSSVKDGVSTLCTAQPGQGGSPGFDDEYDDDFSPGGGLEYADGGTSGSGESGGTGYLGGSSTDLVNDEFANIFIVGGGGAGDSAPGGNAGPDPTSGGNGTTPSGGLFSTYTTTLGGGGGGGYDYYDQAFSGSPPVEANTSGGPGGSGGGGTGNTAGDDDDDPTTGLLPTAGSANTGGGGGGGGTDLGDDTYENDEVFAQAPGSENDNSGSVAGDGADGGSGLVVIRYVVSTTTTTQVSATSLTYGGTVSDTATVSTVGAGSDPTGTVSWYDCFSTSTPPSSCSATSGTLISSSVALTAGSANSGTSTATLSNWTPASGPGYYLLFASYSGDSAHAASADTGANESFQVTPATLYVVPNNQTLTYGTAPPAASFYTFSYYLDAAHSQPISSPSITTAPKCGDSSYTATTAAGTYAGAITCSGGVASDYTFNYSSATLTVIAEATATSTVVDTTSANAGSSVTDTATVTATSGTVAPPGTVDFYYCYSASSAITTCSSTAQLAGTGSAVLAQGASTTSTASLTWTPKSPGYYVMHAVYLGGTSFATSADNGANEAFRVLSLPTAITHTSTGPEDTPQTFDPLVGDRASYGARLPKEVDLCAGMDKAPRCTHDGYTDAAGTYMVVGSTVVYTPTNGFIGTDPDAPHYSFTDTHGERAAAKLIPTVTPRSVAGATTAHTGEPWAGTGEMEGLAVLAGALMLASGEVLRRRRRA